MDREDFEKLQELEHKIYGKRKDDLPHPEEDEDEVLEEDEEVENELDGIEEVKNIDTKDLED